MHLLSPARPHPFVLPAASPRAPLPFLLFAASLRPFSLAPRPARPRPSCIPLRRDPPFAPSSFAAKYADYTETDATTPEEENERLQQEADDYETTTATQLELIGELEEEESPVVNATIPTSSNFDAGNLNFSSIELPPFENLTPAGWDVELWLINIDDIFFTLEILDIVWRILQTVILVRKYWKRSVLAIDDIDMRADKDIPGYSGRAIVHKYVTFLTHPLFSVSVLTAFFLYITYILAAVYSPIYNDYLDGCVDGKTNGTFLTENLYSLAYNYASEQGSSEIVQGLNDYNVRSADVCANFTASTEQNAEQNFQQMDAYATTLNSTRTQVELLLNCVDVADMEDRFDRACCDEPPAAGYAFPACTFASSSETCPRQSLSGCEGPNDSTYEDCPAFAPFQRYLTGSVCYDAAGIGVADLQDQVFNCDALPVCDNVCEGADEALIRAVTKNCGCFAEWLFHSIFIKWAFSFFIYIFLNVSRMICMIGLLRIFWRFLHPGIFTYRATCDREGVYLAPRWLKGAKFQEALKAQLDKQLGKYWLSGFIAFGIGLLLNVPWWVFLSLLSRNLAYEETNGRP